MVQYTTQHWSRLHVMRTLDTYHWSRPSQKSGYSICNLLPYWHAVLPQVEQCCCCRYRFFLERFHSLLGQRRGKVKRRAHELLTKTLEKWQSDIPENPEEIQRWGSRVIHFVTVPSHLGWQCVERVANGLFKMHLFIYLFWNSAEQTH